MMLYKQVEIKLHREANISDPYVEILGKVNDDLTVKVFSSMNLGSDLGKLSWFFLVIFPMILVRRYSDDVTLGETKRIP
jgi:hypothetical protein